MKVLGLIPARGGSKGIPRKNIKNFNGKPLIYYTINESLKSKLIDKLIVSTEDQEIASIAKKYGAEVPFFRPNHLAGDKINDLSVIKHAYNLLVNIKWKIDLVVYLRPTNIFRTHKDIDNSILKLINSKFDSIRSISKSTFSPYLMKRIVGDILIPFIETGYENSRRQELPVTYQINGMVDVIKVKQTIDLDKLYGNKMTFYLMDEFATIDIDNMFDFTIAEYLYPKWRKEQKDV